MMVDVYRIGGGEEPIGRVRMARIYPKSLLDQAYAVAEMDEFGEHIDVERRLVLRPVKEI